MPNMTVHGRHQPHELIEIYISRNAVNTRDYMILNLLVLPGSQAQNHIMHFMISENVHMVPRLAGSPVPDQEYTSGHNVHRNHSRNGLRLQSGGRRGNADGLKCSGSKTVSGQIWPRITSTRTRRKNALPPIIDGCFGPFISWNLRVR